MTHTLVQEIEKQFTKKEVPVLRPGYAVRVHQKIREGEKERVQIFEGLVISLNSGHGVSKMVTVRKVIEGIGVEKIFPLHSPNIVKIEIVKTSGVRRAKLYYMRGLAGKSARLRSKLGLMAEDEKMTKGKTKEVAEEVLEEEVSAEEVVAEAPEAKVEEVTAEAPEVKAEETTAEAEQK